MCSFAPCTSDSTKSTSPMVFASAPSMRSPVIINRLHMRSSNLHRAATLTTPGSNPRRISTNPKQLSRAAITTFETQGNIIPPPFEAPQQIETKNFSLAISCCDISANPPTLETISFTPDLKDASAPRQKSSDCPSNKITFASLLITSFTFCMLPSFNVFGN